MYASKLQYIFIMPSIEWKFNPLLRLSHRISTHSYHNVKSNSPVQSHDMMMHMLPNWYIDIWIYIYINSGFIIEDNILSHEKRRRERVKREGKNRFWWISLMGTVYDMRTSNGNGESIRHKCKRGQNEHNETKKEHREREMHIIPVFDYWLVLVTVFLSVIHKKNTSMKSGYRCTESENAVKLKLIIYTYKIILSHWIRMNWILELGDLT